MSSNTQSERGQGGFEHQITAGIAPAVLVRFPAFAVTSPQEPSLVIIRMIPRPLPPSASSKSIKADGTISGTASLVRSPSAHDLDEISATNGLY